MQGEGRYWYKFLPAISKSEERRDQDVNKTLTPGKKRKIQGGIGGRDHRFRKESGKKRDDVICPSFEKLR